MLHPFTSNTEDVLGRELLAELAAYIGDDPTGSLAPGAQSTATPPTTTEVATSLRLPTDTARRFQGDFALNLLDGQILVAKEMPKEKLWKLRRAFVFDPADPVKSGFMKSIGQDADGELYAITGNFTPTGLEGRIWKIIDASE